MRLILLILFFYCLNAKATNYYVSNAGSDAANGLTTGTSWATTTKVNATATSGDSVFFNKGDTWNSQIIPSSSNIYYGSYGSGAMPVITGLQSVTGFSQAGNIWTKAIVASTGLNMVLINGQIAHKGRIPNTGYSTYISHTFSTLVTSLSGTPNYTGAIAVVRDAPWVLDLSTVTSQVAGTLNISPNLSYNQALFTNGYFLQGLASLVDTTNEYSYDGTTLTVYSATTPTVQISNTDTLVWIRGKSNITFDGINITGANKAAIQFDTCSNITVQNCSFDYSGTLALSALKSSRLNILNNTINHSLSGAVYGRQLDYYTTPVNQCDSAVIIGNTIRNTGTIAGMGLGGNGRYNAIYVQGLNLGPRIEGNTIDSSGYIGIDFHGKKSIIRNNTVSNFCFVKDDGGGIYSVIGTYLDSAYTDSSIVNSNIVFNGIGAPLGTTNGASTASGIYFDNNSRRITADSNTVYSCILGGIYIHESRQITARYNNLYSNSKNIYFYQFDGTPPDSMYFTHNALYINSSSPLIDASGIASSLSNFGTMDSNFYYNPYNYGGNNLINYNGTSYTLSAWQTFSSKDLNSVGIPTTLVTSEIPQLLINTSSVPVTQNLTGTYLSNGVSYNTILFQPYNSAIVLKLGYNVFTTYHELRMKKLTQ